MTEQDRSQTKAQPPHLVTSYDRDAHPVEFGRILALSDGVFAIALTLLVLDLALPVGASGTDLGSAFAGMRDKFGAFAISVVVVGIFYGLHYRLFSLFQRLDGLLLGLNLPYLGLVVLIPFFQRVLSEYPTEPLAYALFAAVLGAISALDGFMLRHAHRRGLLRSPLLGHDARLEMLRAALPVTLFLTSIPLAYLVGPWTVTLWLAIVPVDHYLGRLEHAVSGRPISRSRPLGR
jgi:uncharacterized membrane protein